MRERSATRGQALDALTSLRFFAALAVLLFHMSFVLAPSVRGGSWFLHAAFAGPTGVSFFFILSGFVLTWSARSNDRATGFYRRRLARIGPTHVLTWVIALLVIRHLHASPSPTAAVLSLTWLNAWVPLPDIFNAVNKPSWSLSCEIFFYALSPLLIPALCRLPARARSRAMGMVALGVCAVALASPTLDRILPAGGQGWFVFCFPASRLMEFVAGILLAASVRDGRWPRVPVAVGAALSAAAVAGVDILHEPRFFVAVTLVPFLLLIGAVAQTEIAGGMRVLRHPWLVRAGQWSFALYLVQYPLLEIVGQWHLHTTTGLGTAIVVLLVVGLAVACSGVVHIAWERPLERRLRGPRPDRASADRPGVPAQPAGSPLLGEHPVAGANPVEDRRVGVGDEVLEQ